MKWSVPAKTFLLGEYAAIAGASAILLTTNPCFELELTATESLLGIHPDSPAGLWWQQQRCQGKGLSWHDPYGGRGGLGASSAQFLASYLASCHLQGINAEIDNMLQAYYQSSWAGIGFRPSGYDVIAQSQHGCVYINKQQKRMQIYDWPFKEVSFFLIHTGVKLATHHHLQDTDLPKPIDELSALVDTAQQAFEHTDSKSLICSVNSYHEKLAELRLVAEHSMQLINHFKKYPEVLAVKGCGALGADILLLLCSPENTSSLHNKLLNEQRIVVATEKTLHKAIAPLISSSIIC